MCRLVGGRGKISNDLTSACKDSVQIPEKGKFASEAFLESILLGAWRDGSVVKSTGCSFRGHRFDSQQCYGGSQSSVTRGPGDLVPASGFCSQHT